MTHLPIAAPLITPRRRPAIAAWLWTLGWSAFLACSWTWCIGMFLPGLLLRDFGPMSFLVFALPNIIGAAAFGFVFRRDGASEAFVANHSDACRAFSFVTLAFQWFFLIRLLMPMQLTAAPPLYIIAGLALLSMLLPTPTRSGAWTLVIAGLLFALSLACAGIFTYDNWEQFAGGSLRPVLPAKDLAWMAPVSIFGFLLCPALDLTFHQARRQATGPRGTLAFVLGFCGLFATMIAFTYVYMSVGLQGQSSPWDALRPTVVFIHVMVQLAFTIRLHTAWISERFVPPTDRPQTSPVLAVMVMGVGAAFGANAMAGYAGMDFAEIVYRLFLTFYALIFPAYVWLCAIPTRDRHAGPRLDKLVVLAITIALAGPFYWVGFIERKTLWLAPGIAIILLARLAVRGRAKKVLVPAA
ncbi:MAG: hypothetical protein WC718_14725 [Phycisphaerales bacterium]|jgi:hypothetical protein